MEPWVGNLDLQLTGVANQPSGDFDGRNLRHWQAKPKAERRGKHLIGKNPVFPTARTHNFTRR